MPARHPTPWRIAVALGTRGFLRQWRAGELGILILALAVAVGAISSVGFLTQRFNSAMNARASDLLGGDLVLLSSEPVPRAVEESVTDLGLRTARTSSMRSTVVSGERFQLVSLKAVSTGYPLRGRMRTSAQPFGAGSPEESIPAQGEAWLDSQLALSLDKKPGDSIKVGEIELTVAKLLVLEPDRGGQVFNIAPRLMINLDDLPHTGLIGPGSRVKRRLLMAGTPTAVEFAREALQPLLQPNQQLQGVKDARPELRAALNRAAQFLGLAALTSVLLACAAIAVAARKYAQRHLGNVAILRCLGASQRSVVTIHVVQLGLTGLAGAGIGVLLGLASQPLLGLILGDLIMSDLPAPGPGPALYATAIGLSAVVGFALPPIMGLKSVSPARVLRRDLGSATPVSVWMHAATVLLVALLTWLQSGDLRLAAWFLGASAAALAAIVATGWILVKLLGRVRGRASSAVRFGLSNVSRRAGASVLQISGFGVGLMVLLVLTVVRNDLLDDWQRTIPADAPNYFLINVQPAESDSLSAFLSARNLDAGGIYPMVRARLTAIDDRPVDPSAYANPRAGRLARRETNLSWSQTLPPDNKVLEGEWWTGGNADAGGFSIERDYAQTLGIETGDQLRFRIAGLDFSGTVRNIRSVQWDSLHPNFFVISSPDTLQGYPATFITSFHLPPGNYRTLADLNRRFPSVTIIDVNALVYQVRTIMDQASTGVEFVFGFTLLAGIAVMLASVQATMRERLFEAAVLRTLGALRKRLTLSMLTEFLTLGACAGAVSGLTAIAVAWLLAIMVFSLEFTPNLLVVAWGTVAGAGLSALVGFLGTRRISAVSPMTALRNWDDG